MSWNSSATTFFERVYQLSKDMVTHGFWKENDALLTMAFLQDLISVGYQPPALHSSLTTVINSSVTVVNEQKPFALASKYWLILQ
jgi:hypothetical protein